MAFMEWRRFNFFELNRNVDSGKINEALKGAKVSASSSGHGHLVFGDSEGYVHIVNRLFHVITFRAHEQKICLLQQLQHVGLLVTVGEEESGAAIIKVWDCDRTDKQGLPISVRVSRIFPTTKSATVTALCVHEHQNLLALGFSDGTIILHRGDITRERSAKQSVLKDNANAITGLAFRTTSRVSHLFVASSNQVYLYNITHKDKEQKIPLDSQGCERNCSVLADNAPESHFMIGRKDAIYCYTADGKGPCYASVEGRKTMMQWSRNYLVIVAQDNKLTPVSPDSHNGTSNCETLTILDLQNKFLVFSAPIRGSVCAVLSEWGCFLVLTEDNLLLGLAEKDLQSKLAMLFKKNLYDVAIRIAKSQQYDAEGLADIFRQYGDHLYSKGDHAGAIEQYIKTISKLEPSYVIRKFLDSQLIEHLTTYLQALHKQGLAGEDHTTLLLNCYTKLNRTDKLKEFLLTKDRELDFDVDTAIRVCRQVSAEDALLLAKKHARHDWYIKIQLEDRQQYTEVLDYVAHLEFVEAETNMRKYGSLLLQHAPQQTTDFLKQLCTDYRPSQKPLVDQNELDGNGLPKVEKASPEDFIHLFLNNSEMLVEFLEHMIKVEPHASTLVYNTLVEHYLRVWGAQGEDGDAAQKDIEQKVLRLLQSPDANYDRAQTLILCQLHHFSPGILFLYEEAKMYQHILRYHSSHEDHDALLNCCRKFGTQDPTLWVQALWACAKDPSTPPRVLTEVLQVIERERLLPPLLVIDALASSSTATLGDVRSYLLGVLRAEEELTKQEQALIDKYRSETNAIRQQIHALQTSNVIFRGNLCNACNQHLELPSIHFLCQHSFHQHCFQSCAESENECPVCLPNNKKILDIIKSQEQARTLHESFHSQLERAQDGFSLVADYFGRGVFNQLTVLTTPQTSTKSTTTTVTPTTGMGAEARLRLGEGSSVPGSRSSSANSKNANTLGANTHRPVTRVSPTPQSKAATLAPTVRPASARSSPTSQSSRHSPQPSTTRRSPQPARVSPVTASNPFGEEDDYDETKNPFAEDEPQSTNPFDEDDYDKNLNPFES